MQIRGGMPIGGRPFGPWMLQAIGGPPPPEAVRRRQQQEIEALQQQAEAFRRDLRRNNADGTARRTLTPARKAEMRRIRDKLHRLGPTAAERAELQRIRSNLVALDALDAIGGAVVTEVSPEVRVRAERAAAFAAARCGLPTPEVVFFRPLSEEARRYFGFTHADVRDRVFISVTALREEEQLERTVFHEVRHLMQHPDVNTSVREHDANEFAEQTLCYWRGQHGC